MEQLFLKKNCSWTCTLREKNDVQLTFDDSYVYYVSKIDVFRLPCFDPWMSYIVRNDGGAT